jgi:hypothetical protein
LGFSVRLLGQNLVPEPPAIIRQYKFSIFSIKVSSVILTGVYSDRLKTYKKITKRFGFFLS